MIKDHGDLRVIPSGRKASDDDGEDDDGETVSVDLTGARFREDPAQLWRCAYDEAGRLMRQDFWVPDMSGVDWEGVLREYRPLLDRIQTAEEFTDLLWEVFGELGTSHAYAITVENSHGRDSRGELGKLGADLSQEADGGWRVDPVHGPAPLLADAAGKPVELTVRCTVRG